MPISLEPGALVGDRYRLDRELGRGGMGAVWAATHQVTKKRVALKFIKNENATDDHRKRLVREARAASAVHHPNVVEVHDVLELDGQPLLVMEFLVGESFEAKLEREGKLDVAETARVLLPVVSALGTAHSVGIVHRDLKPDNIFLVEGPPRSVKILDFGIAKLTATEGDAAATAGLTATGGIMGTPYYMAPEQAFGEKTVDHRADIWALGMILYRCLSGVLPTQADNVGQVFKLIVARGITPLSEVEPGLPDDLSALVTRMLSRAVKARPTNLLEVRDVLARHASVEVPDFGPPTSTATVARTSEHGATAPDAGGSSIMEAFAETEDAKSAISADRTTSTVDGVSRAGRAKPDQALAARGQDRGWLGKAAIAGGAVAVLAAGGWLWRAGTAEPSATAPAAASPAEGATAAPSPAVTATASSTPIVTPTPSTTATASAAVTRPPAAPRALPTGPSSGATPPSKPKASANPLDRAD